MSKLTRISFAGIDEGTDPQELKDIYRDFPMVEFGVLCSRNWRENGIRYLAPSFVKNFDVPLCAHLCGAFARDVAFWSLWGGFSRQYLPSLSIWDRYQLNIAPYIEAWDWYVKENSEQCIIQVRSFEQTRQIRASEKCSILIDASGGTGLDVSFAGMVIPSEHIFPWKKIGFAGGITPDNVVEKVRQIQQIPGLGDYWIDMESGVRTNDWFDTKKVRAVLENLRKERLI